MLLTLLRDPHVWPVKNIIQLFKFSLFLFTRKGVVLMHVVVLMVSYKTIFLFKPIKKKHADFCKKSSL